MLGLVFVIVVVAVFVAVLVSCGRKNATITRNLERNQPDFVGFFLGAAIGDAIGVGVEMVSAMGISQLVRERRGLFERYMSVREGSYAKNYTPGNYSDDTEGILANAKALIDHRRRTHFITQQTLLDYTAAEYDKTVTGFSGGRQGHGSILPYLQDRRVSVIDAIRRKHSSQDAKVPGNAPLMRAAVFAFVNDDTQRVRLAACNADMTHPHPLARCASATLIYAVRCLVGSAAAGRCCCNDIIRLAHSYGCDDKGVAAYLARVDGMAAPVLSGASLLLDRKTLVGSTWGLKCDCVRTLGAVLYFLKHLDEKNPWNTLKQCVMLGGDVDTLASVVMSVAGARGSIDWGGGDTWPRWTIEGLEGVDHLLDVAAQFRRWYISQ